MPACCDGGCVGGSGMGGGWETLIKLWQILPPSSPCLIPWAQPALFLFHQMAEMLVISDWSYISVSNVFECFTCFKCDHLPRNVLKLGSNVFISCEKDINRTKYHFPFGNRRKLPNISKYLGYPPNISTALNILQTILPLFKNYFASFV